MDTPIGQFVLIGNFRRRLARELLVASLLLEAMPGAPSSVLAPSRGALVASVLLVTMPGAPSVLAPSRGAPNSILAPRSDARSP